MEPPGEGHRLGPQSPEPLSGHGGPPTGPPEPCTCSLNTAVPARVRESQARAPEPCSPLSGHGGPPPWPRAAASPEVTSDLCTAGCEPPLQTPPHGRPDVWLPRHSAHPGVQHRSMLRHQPEIPGEGGLPRVQWRWLRSGLPPGLGQVVSGLGTEQASWRVPPPRSWTAPAGHERSKSGWGGKSWSGGPSHRATRA